MSTFSKQIIYLEFYLYQDDMATILESGLNWQKDKGLVSPTWLPQLVKFFKNDRKLNKVQKTKKTPIYLLWDIDKILAFLRFFRFLVFDKKLFALQLVLLPLESDTKFIDFNPKIFNEKKLNWSNFTFLKSLMLSKHVPIAYFHFLRDTKWFP